MPPVDRHPRRERDGYQSQSDGSVEIGTTKDIHEASGLGDHVFANAATLFGHGTRRGIDLHVFVSRTCEDSLRRRGWSLPEQT